MTNTSPPSPASTNLPAAALRHGHWILTYAPNGQRPRWHRAVAGRTTGSVLEVELLNRTTTAPPFLQLYSPQDLLTVATGDPGPDPDLIRIARQALNPAWPATTFDVLHVRGGVQVMWTDGPTRSAVRTLLALCLGDYRADLYRRNSMLAYAVWLIRTYPESDPQRLRHLSSLAGPRHELESPPDAETLVSRMAKTLCASAASTAGGTFHDLKMVYAKLGYDTLAAIAA